VAVKAVLLFAVAVVGLRLEERRTRARSPNSIWRSPSRSAPSPAGRDRTGRVVHFLGSRWLLSCDRPSAACPRQPWRAQEWELALAGL